MFPTSEQLVETKLELQLSSLCTNLYTEYPLTMLHAVWTHLRFPECLEAEESQTSLNEWSGLVTVRFRC